MSFNVKLKFPHSWTRAIVKAKLEYAFEKHPEWHLFVQEYAIDGYCATFTAKVFSYTCIGRIDIQDTHIEYHLKDVPLIAHPFKSLFVSEMTKIVSHILK